MGSIFLRNIQNHGVRKLFFTGIVLQYMTSMISLYKINMGPLFDMLRVSYYLNIPLHTMDDKSYVFKYNYTFCCKTMSSSHDSYCIHR
jgi:hypothetical protein